MKNFGKGLLVMLAIIIGVPLFIILLCAIFGFGALLVAAPQIFAWVIAILLLISIPGLVVGLIVGKHDKK